MKTQYHIFDNQTPHFNCPFCGCDTMYFYSDDLVDDRLQTHECDHFVLMSNDISGIDLDPFSHQDQLGYTPSIEQFSKYFSDEYTCCVLNVYDKENDERYNNYLIYKEIT